VAADPTHVGLYAGHDPTELEIVASKRARRDRIENTAKGISQRLGLI
jgi:hypothetical protein